MKTYMSFPDVGNSSVIQKGQRENTDEHAGILTSPNLLNISLKPQHA
jgi:hypothetical protein